jgi:hypothetical protein
MIRRDCRRLQRRLPTDVRTLPVRLTAVSTRREVITTVYVKQRWRLNYADVSEMLFDHHHDHHNRLFQPLRDVLQSAILSQPLQRRTLSG